tara:strand:+ start:68 stop:436 length:369 start_codon:yes stop_codon:yes gene_type:complete
MSISDVSKILNLINPKTKKPQNHILRYWEKEFKQIRPKKINNRRYYSENQIEIIKMVKFLLKNEGMSIIGVKKLLNSDIKKLDVNNFDGLKVNHYKKFLKFKSTSLLKKINKLKNYGKKNSS